MKKLRNLQAGGVKTWLMQEALVTWSKKSLNSDAGHVHEMLRKNYVLEKPW